MVIDTKVNESSFLKCLFRLVVFIVMVTSILFVGYGLKLGFFDDKMLLVNYIKNFGLLAPFLFILLQLFQVVVPVIPGGISCLAGVLAFGPVWGFFYNYFGLILGSCVVYYLSRKYGLWLIHKFFKDETIDKYFNYIKNDLFEKIFFLGIMFPGLPDDLLCYMAGISSISFKKFFIYILIGKPVTLFMYSLFINLL